MNIVAAIDNSEAARPVLARAIRVARQSNATLHVVHVFEPPAVVYSMAGVYDFDDEAMAEAEADAVWAPATPILNEADVHWIREDLRGYPATTIVDYAAEVDADLIVIGSRGRGDFLSLALGSTSHGVLHRAGCDVLIVRGRSEET